MKVFFRAFSFLLILSLYSLNQGHAQTELRYVPGYCNKVVATTNCSQNTDNVWKGGAYIDCGTNTVDTRRIALYRPAKYVYQLQRLNSNGSWVNEGSPKGLNVGSTEYRDLQYGQTYRVKVSCRRGTSEPVYSISNPCAAPIGVAQGSSTIVYTNALEIQPYNGFDDSDLVGMLNPFGSLPNFGGGGTTLGSRMIFCRDHVEALGDVVYDISNSHGADHYQINLARTAPTSAWAGGSWYDYEPASIVGNVNIFEQGWIPKYGNGSTWPGVYTVSILGYQDCDSSPWAIHSDFFEIIDYSDTRCRVRTQEIPQDVTIFPNPVSSGVLKYNTTGENMELLDYTIFSLSGQKVQEGHANGGIGELNVSDLSTGMYIISFQSDKETFTKRISIVK
jgi:hypothetical protein